MDEQNLDVVESLNPQEEVTEVTETAEESETSQPDIEELTKRAALAEDYKIRAENAERENKKLKKPDVHSKDSELTPKDVYALMNAKVAEEDIEQVADYAKFKKITVAEALKSTVVKTLLQESEETRRTANATQTRGGARGTSQVSGADVLAQAEKTGQLTDSEEDIQKLWLARQARRKN